MRFQARPRDIFVLGIAAFILILLQSEYYMFLVSHSASSPVISDNGHPKGMVSSDHVHGPGSDMRHRETRHPRVMVGIVADEPQLHALGRAALETWIQLAPPEWNVTFFVGSETSLDGFPLPERVVKLPCNNEYPPVRKIFQVWQYFYRHMYRDYEWFLQMDADSYLNVDIMQSVISLLAAEGHYQFYTGSRGYGRHSEREILGLNGRPYCVGMGYIIGKSVLNRFGGFIKDCFNNLMTNHSDTELARCIYAHSNVECTESPIPFLPVYYRNDRGVIMGRNFQKTMQMSLDFHDTPPTSYFKTPLIHPLKKPEFFLRFHEQLVKYLRPPQDGVRQRGETASPFDYASAVADMKTSCVNNPVRQLQSKGVFFPECPSPRADLEPNSFAIPIYVLNLEDKIGNYKHIEGQFKAMGYQIHRFVAINGRKRGLSLGSLRPGEVGYRETMRQLIIKAQRDGIDRFVVLDDDAVPHKQFVDRFQNLLNDDRCGGYMFSQGRGGVLLLGSSIWIDGTYPKFGPFMDGWKMVQADIKNSSYDAQCYNAGNKTLGSFGVMLHRSVYQPILDWLDASDQPYDWVFSYLSDLGYIVRTAFPNLIIQDVRHESQVDPGRTFQDDAFRRAKLHKWNLDDYMFD